MTISAERFNNDKPITFWEGEKPGDGERHLDALDERWAAERGKNGNTDFHYDAGKPRVDLIPPGPIIEIAKVFTYGCKKYGDRNWEEHADEWSHGQLAASIERHLLAYKAGEDIDTESGHRHLAHLGCDVLMLLALILKGRGIDDRSKL